jgi:CBS-domain-containing membrane protein
MYKHRVEEWMSAPPIVVSPTTSLEEAQRLMDQRGVRRLPVVRDSHLVEIITRGDLRARPSCKELPLRPRTESWRSLFQWPKGSPPVAFRFQPANGPKPMT